MFLFVFLMVTLMAAPGALLAQEAPKPQLISITVTRVKPEMLQEWQDLIKNELNPALQKAGVPFRSVYATAVFGDSYEYVSISPITNFAQYDKPSPLVTAMGQEGLTRYGHKIRKCVDGSYTYAVRLRPDLSIMTEMTGPPKFAVISHVRVVPGKNSEFENFLKTDIVANYKKLNLPGYFVEQTIFGGDANSYTTITVVNSFSDLDKGPLLNQAVGEEGAQKILQRGGAFITSLERYFSRFVPELSFAAAAPAK
jgi:hypothetical protein